ncbi:unnamed protein product, partial [Effrenium voratum]
ASANDVGCNASPAEGCAASANDVGCNASPADEGYSASSAADSRDAKGGAGADAADTCARLDGAPRLHAEPVAHGATRGAAGHGEAALRGPPCDHSPAAALHGFAEPRHADHRALRPVPGHAHHGPLPAHAGLGAVAGGVAGDDLPPGASLADPAAGLPRAPRRRRARARRGAAALAGGAAHAVACEAEGPARRPRGGRAPSPAHGGGAREAPALRVEPRHRAGGRAGAQRPHLPQQLAATG